MLDGTNQIRPNKRGKFTKVRVATVGKGQFWPENTIVTLQSFHCLIGTGNENKAKSEKYEARFYGRYLELTMVDGKPIFLSMCKPRSAFMSAETLKNNGVAVPE